MGQEDFWGFHRTTEPQIQMPMKVYAGKVHVHKNVKFMTSSAFWKCENSKSEFHAHEK